MGSPNDSRQRLQRPLERLVPNPKLRLMDQCREVMRFHRLALRSEEAYLQWIKRFIVFCRDHPHLTPSLSPPSNGAERGKRWRHPKDMGEAEVTAFLTYLAVERHVAVATQNQALGALLFLYQKVLGRELQFLEDVKRAQRRQKVPVVLSREEVQRLLLAVPEKHRLFCQLLYGTGMRLMEGLRLRVHPVR